MKPNKLILSLLSAAALLTITRRRYRPVTKWTTNLIVASIIDPAALTLTTSSWMATACRLTPPTHKFKTLQAAYAAAEEGTVVAKTDRHRHQAQRLSAPGRQQRAQLAASTRKLDHLPGPHQ